MRRARVASTTVVLRYPKRSWAYLGLDKISRSRACGQSFDITGEEQPARKQSATHISHVVRINRSGMSRRVREWERFANAFFQVRPGRGVNEIKEYASS